MERIITVCVTIVALAAMAGIFHACDRQDRQAFELRRVYVEKCKGTPEDAKRMYPTVDKD